MIKRLLLTIILVTAMLGMGWWLLAVHPEPVEAGHPEPVEVAELTSTSNSVLIDDFEDVTDWNDLILESDNVQEGNGAGYWDDHPTKTYIRKDYAIPLDLTDTEQVSFWLYSEVANGAGVNIILDSDNPSDPTGWDYYAYEFFLDWTGWRYLTIPRTDFRESRVPTGWHEINYVRFAASGWGNTPQPDSVLIVDDMRFGLTIITAVDIDTSYRAGDFVYTYTVKLQDQTTTTRNFTLESIPEASNPFVTTVFNPNVTLPANGAAEVVVETVIPTGHTPLDGYITTLVVKEGMSTIDSATVQAAAPLGERAHPRVLLDSADFTRIADWTATHTWAVDVQDEVMESADEWPLDFTTTYSLTQWALPPEGGQWSQYYICPDGTSLQYQGPNLHYCPSDGQYYTGWPYDQVIYSRMFSDLAKATRDLGLAYQLTNNSAYAISATEILLTLATTYETYPYHNRNNESEENGGRVLSQTLDEAGWGYKIAWGYDLIAETLTSAERHTIENRLLRPLATTILRNETGESNWQSWHNAAIGAVGFAIDEPVLIDYALNNPENGFYFQMDESVLAEGLWYEGAWGYHFYALEPIQYLAEMAQRAGIDLYQEPNLYNMFAVPFAVAQPDNGLPAFNDSRVGVNLNYEQAFYEGAYRMYGDDAFANHIDTSDRGRAGLFWGAETIPAVTLPTPTSQLLPDAGLAIIRNNDDEQNPLYLALDFGPHGGWHGHYDKLGYILFSDGKLHGVDPGTVSYAAATHESWDKATVAHNTIVVDEQNQLEAMGNLLVHHPLPSLALVSADAGTAYTHTTLLRTMVVASDYVVDHVEIVSDQPRQIDWVHHSYGIHASTTLTTAPYNSFPGVSNGYEHLDNAVSATTSDSWQAMIDSAENRLGQPYGSLWTSVDTISATYTHGEQDGAVGTIDYDFNGGGGYALFHTAIAEPIAEIPDTLTLDVYGDGSNNGLTLRVYDVTDERFVFTVGNIDWTGWRTITATQISTWPSYLGNDDDMFDIPAQQVTLELDSGGADSGTLHVDNIVLVYPIAGEQVIETFEGQLSGLNVWGIGGENTTIVLGDGLEPDRIGRMPFVMQRRTAQETTFITLLEPMTDTVDVQQVITLTTNAIDEALALHIEHLLFSEQLFATAHHTPTSTYTFGIASCDGALCAIRHDTGGNLMRLVLGGGTILVENGTQLFHASAPLDIQIDYLNGGTELAIATNNTLTEVVTIYAPNTTTVTVNGIPTPYGRDGDYVIINAAPTAISVHQTTTTTPFAIAWLILLLLCACVALNARPLQTIRPRVFPTQRGG